MTITSSSAGRTLPRRVAQVVTSSTSTPRRAFWAAFAAFFAVSFLWGLSNPVMASVDEPAHIIKAAATVRGSVDSGVEGAATGIGEVEVPTLYEWLSLYPNCFAFNPEASASCQPDIVGDLEAPAEVSTSALNYNPLYYVVVGWPTLLPQGDHTVYLVRGMTALVSSALLALAVSLVAGLPRRRWVALALLLPLTPTFVNLLGSVNPQSFEVAGALLLWVALLALLRHPDPAQTTLRLSAVVAATVPLANARSLGPLMVVIILVLCILTVPWRRTVEVLSDRRAWWALAACVAACAVSVGWTVTQGALPEGATQNAIPLRDNLEWTLGLTSQYVQQMVLALGWLDVPAPLWTVLLLVACLGLVVLVGWASARWRDRLVLALTAATVFGLPVLSHALQANEIGYFWQGRYAFPVAVGLVVLAGFAMSRVEDQIPSWFSLDVAMTVATIVAAVQTVVLFANLHRYSVGASGGWITTLQQPLPWTPVPAVVFLALYAGAWVALSVALLRVGSPSSSEPAVVTATSEEPVTQGTETV